ncbi:MAG TPA: ligase-associated DNA damage response endonuclease PdeM [Afifellaceae bacterium]|nr:ligase-associated DNA damage response endonuclease PdeM [Afifellaceae bacterium]
MRTDFAGGEAEAVPAGLVVGLAGAEAVLDPAGALWLPASRALVVADLHLEKASSFARRRVFLPPYDSLATLARLGEVIERRAPSIVVCLGDSLHDVDGADRLGAAARTRLAALQEGRTWVWMAGNHDPAPPAALGGEAADILTLDGLTFRHEPSPGPAKGEVAGHLHPAARLCRNGASLRRRAFALGGERLIMPAFGALAGGLNILDEAFAGLFPAGGLTAFLLGRQRLFPLFASALSPD